MISWFLFQLIGTSGLVRLSCLIQQLSFHILSSFGLQVLPPMLCTTKVKEPFQSLASKKNNKIMTTGEKQKKRSRNKAIYKILLVCINIPISTKIVESYQFVSFQEIGLKKLNKKTKLIPSNFKNQGFCVKSQSVYTHVSISTTFQFFFFKNFFNSRD